MKQRFCTGEVMARGLTDTQLRIDALLGWGLLAFDKFADALVYPSLAGWIFFLLLVVILGRVITLQGSAKQVKLAALAGWGMFAVVKLADAVVYSSLHAWVLFLGTTVILIHVAYTKTPD